MLIIWCILEYYEMIDYVFLGYGECIKYIEGLLTVYTVRIKYIEVCCLQYTLLKLNI